MDQAALGRARARCPKRNTPVILVYKIGSSVRPLSDFQELLAETYGSRKQHQDVFTAGKLTIGALAGGADDVSSTVCVSPGAVPWFISTLAK